MILQTKKPNIALNIAYSKQSINRDEIELFKKNLIRLFARINNLESEEHNKNIVADFLKDTFYKTDYEINTAGRKDLVIHLGKTSSEPVAVIIEAKRPDDKTGMITSQKANTKSVHELIHYYLHERFIKNNKEIRNLIITDIYQWYIIDASEFERIFFNNKQFVKTYKEWYDGFLPGKNTDWFYQEIAKPFIDKEIQELECTYFNLHDYDSIIKNEDKTDDAKLIQLYKILSPQHLLKQTFTNDNNTLNKDFYNELLHIIGLEELKNSLKKIIGRKPKNRNAGSLLENTIYILSIRNKIANIERPDLFGETEEDQIFSIALELCITWLNRILFLKLLEGQLIKYHKGNREFTFLNSNKIKDFDELDELFFEVLAIKPEMRSGSVNEKFGNLPYLNSSLFERTELESKTIQISDLKDSLDLPIFDFTVQKDTTGKRISGNKNTLEYLFSFLNAYNFSSDIIAEIQEENKTIISAAVLGLIFEKLNGYKDGSFYTPGFITTYICRETIRKAVIQKFSIFHKRKISDFEHLKEFIDPTDKEQRQKANEVINSIKICDPAVGSGHFLVSALNEMIAIKSELQILSYVNGQRIKEYKILNENDELIITDKETDEAFSYFLNEKHRPIEELQLLQESLFNEKRNLIEKSLFGVDINPKSVLICRLRLWIELLKNSFYTHESNFKYLETLPNIDINIKTGNSLISKFDTGLNIFERSAVKTLIKQYKINTNEYKNCTDYKQKESYRVTIKRIKTELEKFAIPQDNSYKEYLAKKKELDILSEIRTGNVERFKKLAELAEQVVELEKKYLSNYQQIYSDSLEWSLEFPEILTDDGDFIGFDLIIGNPPYIGIEDIPWDFRRFYETIFKTAKGRFDLYSLFIERVTKILTPTGTFGFIVPGKFLNNKQFVIARKIICNNHHSVSIVTIDNKVFEEAQVNSAIVMYHYAIENREYISKKLTNKDVEEISKVVLSSILKDKELIFKVEIDEVNEVLLKKIESKCLKVKDIGEVKDGIVAGVIKDVLYLNSKEGKECRKLYFGKNLSKYSIKETNVWINYKPEEMMLEEIKRKGDKRPGLWMRDKKIFEREKILTRFVAKEIIATYDNENRYYEHTLHSTFISDDRFKTKYVLALFNSNLFKFYYQKSNSQGGNLFPQVRISSVENLPIKLVDMNVQNKIIKLVDKILNIKQTKENAETSDVEKQLDKIVYQIYDITSDEINIVEHP